MPRYKPCGGCLSAKIQSILDEDLEPLAEEVITKIILTFHGEGDIKVSSPDPIAYMVSREKFDYYLFKKAKAAGANTRASEAVTDIEILEEGYLVFYSNQKRETEVLTQLCRGKSYKMIANALFISEETVRCHIKNIYKKLEVHSQTEAVVKALKEKLVTT